MSRFEGHVLPGIAFILLAIWETVVLMRNVFECHFLRKPFTWHKLSRRQRQLQVGGRRSRLPPWDLTFRMAAITAGILGECIRGLDRYLHFYRLHNMQHFTMYLGFLLPTIVEILAYYDVPWLCPSMEAMSTALAFAIEGVLFLWHLHGRTQMDLQVHMLLIYVVGFCILASALHGFVRDDPRPRYLLCYAVMLQGVWLIIVGFVLYPPPAFPTWDQDSHEENMIITSMFAWNAIGICAFQTLVTALTYRSVKKRLSNAGKYFRDVEGTLGESGVKPANGYTRLMTEDDNLAVTQYSD